MNENDSPWKKWQLRVTTIAGLVAILSALLTWSPKARDMIRGLFKKAPPAVEEIKNKPTQDSTKKPTPDDTKRQPEPFTHAKAPPGQYINTKILRREGVKQAAILVRQESKDSLPNLESAIGSLLTKRGIEPVQSFFKPAFIQEGRANSLFAGDWTVSEQLQLGRHVDYVLVGFGNVSYSSNQELGGLLTANLQLELKCLNVVSQRICNSKTFNAPGAGYTQAAALQSAVEHLQHQLESFVREAF